MRWKRRGPRRNDTQAPFSIALDSALLHVERMHTALFAGFDSASAELVSIAGDDEVVGEMRGRAALALSCWHAAAGRYPPALDWATLAAAQTADAARRTHKRSVLQCVDLHNRLGSSAAAASCLEAATRTLGNDTELWLMKANAARVRHVSDDERLGLINRAFHDTKAVALRMAEPRRPLELANLAGRVEAGRENASLPRLSVVMPCFDAAEHLPVAAESVLAQTAGDIELILVDDGSRDGGATWAAIERLAAADKRVVAIRHLSNRGAYAARNSGLARATGAFVTVHDADDWSHPQKFEKQIRHLLAAGARANTTSAVRVTGALDFVLKSTNATLLVENTSSLMMRRADIAALGGWDEARIGADNELMLRFEAVYGERTRILPTVPLTFILTRPASLTGSPLTSLSTLHYGARAEYRAAYQHWHRAESGSRDPDFRVMAGSHRFPAPSITRMKPAGPLRFDAVFVMDCTRPAVTATALWRAGKAAGWRLALWHLPTRDSVADSTDPSIREAIEAGLVEMIVAGEEAECAELVVPDPAILSELPLGLPVIRHQRQWVADADGEAWRANFRALFGADAEPTTDPLRSLTESLAARTR